MATSLPFSQVDSSITRQYGGSGLGLSIVWKLANMMGGSAGCESEIGKGSRFWFRIQAEHSIEDMDNSAHTDQSDPSDEFALLGNILLVEDNDTNRIVADIFIRKFGGNVLFAENGQQAVDIVQKEHAIDLILMDLHMPIMDGYTATQRIRAWELENHQPRHPIIAVTSDAFEEDRQRCFATGMDDFIVKPFVLDEMKNTLAKWMPNKTKQTSSHTQKEVDQLLIIQHIHNLIPLLEESQFDAIDYFHVLEEAVSGTALASEFAHIGKIIKQCHFHAAVGKLHEMMESQGWAF